MDSQQGAVLLAEVAELLFLAGHLPGHRDVLLQLGLQPPPGWTASTPLQATRVLRNAGFCWKLRP